MVGMGGEEGRESTDTKKITVSDVPGREGVHNPMLPPEGSTHRLKTLV